MSNGRMQVPTNVVTGFLGIAGLALVSSACHPGGGDGDGGARLQCPGGMSRLGHTFDEGASVFPGDPSPHIELATTIPEDGYQVELVTTGTHTGTHLDAPGHFIEGGRTIDQLEASEFVWPAYVVDVRDRMAAEADDGFQLTQADLEAWEADHGRIPEGAMVILRTGFDVLYGTPAFLDAAPGFSGDAVQWMVDNRGIGGVGSDTFGPDATSDLDFSATFTILSNDRVALPGLDDLERLALTGDILMAPTVALTDGSGYQTDPLACHGGGEPPSRRAGSEPVVLGQSPASHLGDALR